MTEQIQQNSSKEVLPGDGAAQFLRVVALFLFIACLGAAALSAFSEEQFIVAAACALAGFTVLAVFYVLAAICENVLLIAKNSIKNESK
ncbi:hypothetical protein [Rheinheimera baltica]|uniref:hypothetical protein n=1 Tax=Rheinheimera baltica TaxID=67576 RepID=UPI00041B5387|nr:hypothetical protein [Rheinheimera baltica]